MTINDSVLEAYGEKELDRYTHWVYVLECHLTRYLNSYDDYNRFINKRLSYEPDWARQAWEADRCLYVGQTENLEKRLGQHFQQNRGSDFTSIYEPRAIKSLWPKMSRNQAEYAEESIGKSYYDDDSVFAYWK